MKEIKTLITNSIIKRAFINVKIIFYSLLRYKGYHLLKNNKKYKNIHNGKRCFIFGSGPSLMNIDFGLFENEYVFTVNQLPRKKDFDKLKSNYHFWADDCFFDGNKNTIEIMKKN